MRLIELSFLTILGDSFDSAVDELVELGDMQEMIREEILRENQTKHGRSKQRLNGKHVINWSAKHGRSSMPRYLPCTRMF